jgi:chromosome partitioning protein
VLQKRTHPLEAAVPSSLAEGLHVWAATDRLRGAENGLQERPAALGKALARPLEATRGQFALVVVDTGPTLGPLTVAVLAAADGVLVPVTGTDMAVDGLAELLRTLDDVREGLNPAAQLLGVLPFAMDYRTSVASDVKEALRLKVPKALLASEVRVSAAAISLYSTRRTAWEAGADARGAEDYPRVLAEVCKRLKVAR